MKSVCIVGAGPGGLVAAKTFLETGKFSVTIFEQGSALGGLWRFNSGARGNGYLSATTPTNLSRFTVSFSDLAWESVPLRNGKLRMFPRASQVGEYLVEYAKRYIPDNVIQYQHRVVQTKLAHGSGDAASKWTVTVRSSNNKTIEGTFDYLINASGFYATPCSLDVQLPAGAKTQAIHSSHFNSLDDLYPDPSLDVRNTSIHVLGGGNSGGEAAAAVAFQLSAALHSADRAGNKRFEGVNIVHLITRPFFAIPPYIPTSAAPTFSPLDVQFYDLRFRAADKEISSASGRLPMSMTQTRHRAMRNMSGDHKDLNAPALQYQPEDETTFAPYAALTEAYQEYVRAQTLQPVLARLTTANAEGETPWITTESKKPDGSTITHQHVSSILYATGYDSTTGLSFLPEDVKAKLEFDPKSTRLPILLHYWQTHNPGVPNLGFVGFYEGPYWGIMEMQARILAALWSGLLPELPPLQYESPPALRDLRIGMAARDRDVPQYWFSDYVAYMEEASRTLGLTRNDAPFKGPRDGMVAAARYLPVDASQLRHREAHTTMHSLHGAVQVMQAGKYRARAVFRALQGYWQLERQLTSKRPDMPSGVFRGKAVFHPRNVTNDDYDGEYLYIETGTFTTSTGFNMSATRRYVYRYCEARDELSAWFVKVDDDRAVDYLWHTLAFAPVPVVEAAENASVNVTAKADHLCDNDFYETSYAFPLRVISLPEFSVQHAVKGPAKDYIGSARYWRG